MNPFLDQILKRWEAMQNPGRFGGAPQWGQQGFRFSSLRNTEEGPTIQDLLNKQNAQYLQTGTFENNGNLGGAEFLRANGFMPSTIPRPGIRPSPAGGSAGIATGRPGPNPYNQSADPFGAQAFRIEPSNRLAMGFTGFGNPRNYARTS